MFTLVDSPTLWPHVCAHCGGNYHGPHAFTGRRTPPAPFPDQPAREVAMYVCEQCRRWLAALDDLSPTSKVTEAREAERLAVENRDAFGAEVVQLRERLAAVTAAEVEARGRAGSAEENLRVLTVLLEEQRELTRRAEHAVPGRFDQAPTAAEPAAPKRRARAGAA